MRVESMSSTMKCATSKTRKPAPYATPSPALHLIHDARRDLEQPCSFLEAQKVG